MNQLFIPVFKISHAPKFPVQNKNDKGIVFDYLEEGLTGLTVVFSVISKGMI